MKIIHSIYDDPWNPWLGGGGALRTFEINRRLTSRHDITILCGRYPGARAIEERDGLTFVRLGHDGSYPLSRLTFALSASRYVARVDFDLWVYGFSAFAPLYAGPALRQSALLEYFHVMGEHAAEKRPIAGRLAPFIEQATLRAYPNVLAISPSVQNELKAIRGDDGLHLVYTGVADSSFVEPNDEGDYILFFGRLDTYTKGIDLLFEAFATIKDDGVRLVVAGRGSPERQQELEALAGQLGISSRVEFKGSVSEDTRTELYRHAIFFCSPSRYEGWCIAAVEAAAAGRPVVGTRIPGMIDAVRDGETGLLVPPDDVRALSEAMNHLLASPSKRAALGRAGRTWAEQFTWDRIASDQERVYESVAP